MDPASRSEIRTKNPLVVAATLTINSCENVAHHSIVELQPKRMLRAEEAPTEPCKRMTKLYAP
ncbi:MAG: hypothetical protein H0T62_10095 [Parachlamydiaceae bacterium]|nr:hypothetical protein [Parachlamydiaceae bacterium]